MRAVITVIGKDTIGILAKVSKECAKFNVNVTDVTQSVLQDMFAMIMLVDLGASETSLVQLADRLAFIGTSMGLKIHVMHENIFNLMHQI